MNGYADGAAVNLSSVQTSDLVSHRVLCAHSWVIVETACYRIFTFLITAITALPLTGSPAEASASASRRTC